jgi:hypothetical protein
MILTDEELKSIYDDHRDQMVSIQLGRSVEAAVLAKIASGQEPVVWLPMETAPKDGTIVRLLVQFTERSLEDSELPQATIGANYSHNTQEDQDWQFAGWSWTGDCFSEGEGTALGWLPLHGNAPAQPIASEGRSGIWSLGEIDGCWREIDFWSRKVNASHPGVLRIVWQFEGEGESNACQTFAASVVDLLNRTAPAQQPIARGQEPVSASPMNKRRVSDAIRGAYDLGYSDARNAQSIPGDSAPGYKGWDVEADYGSALINALYPAPAQQPLASGQEPVAWQTFDGDGGYEFRQFAENETYHDDYIKRNGEKYSTWVTPLYTHPAPAQQPLTLREMAAAIGTFADDAINIARAIEYAHGIKEKP